MEKNKYAALYYILLEDLRSYKRGLPNLPNESENAGSIPAELQHKLRVAYDLLYPNYRGVNVFAQPGHQIKYNACSRTFATNSEEEARKYLNENAVYTIKRSWVGSMLVIVELNEVPGVNFELGSFVDAQQRARDEEALLREYGPELEQDMKRVEDIL